MKGLIPTLLCDFYKVGHYFQYPQNTEVVFSTWTPRSGKHAVHIKEVVAFGFQGFVKEFLIEFFNDNFFGREKEQIVSEYSRYLKNCLFIQTPYTKHIEDLHDLGYLPLLIKSVDEGTLVPFRVPMLTVENTDPRFFWLTNYFETLMSANLWKPATSASIALVYRQILDKYALETTGSTAGVEFQGHDFSMRGLSGLEDSARTGIGHLLSFVGTDTIPAIQYAEEYYGANIEKELVGCSVSASEHSVMCAGSKDSELETYRRLIEDVYPTGIVSLVSDTWDLWNVITNILPQLKDKIMARNGGEGSLDKVVIRPDSGDPADILCGTVEVKNINSGTELKRLVYQAQKDYDDGYPPENYYVKLVDKIYNIHSSWENNESKVVATEVTLTPEQKGVVELLYDIFGGTVNAQGYKLLDSHIGAIYGDAITIERCTDICERLKAKGFASVNVVYGIGSYTYQYNTRDTLGFAMKSTSVTINGEEIAIFKDPVTDDGVKKSAVGRVTVHKNNSTGVLEIYDNGRAADSSTHSGNLLTPLFENGKLLKETTLAEIRNKLK